MIPWNEVNGWWCSERAAPAGTRVYVVSLYRDGRACADVIHVLVRPMGVGRDRGRRVRCVVACPSSGVVLGSRTVRTARRALGTPDTWGGEFCPAPSSDAVRSVVERVLAHPLKLALVRLGVA